MSTASITAVRNPGSENDALVIRGTFPMEELSVSPTDGGLELFLIDGDMAPVYVSQLPAGRFVQRGEDGNIYKFVDRAGDVAEANGLRSARVRIRPASSSVKIRVVVDRLELPIGAFQGTLTVTFLFGDDAGGDCITGLGLSCVATTTRLECHRS
jgi:hypothetical protein